MLEVNNLGFRPAKPLGNQDFQVRFRAGPLGPGSLFLDPTLNPEP